MKHLFFFLYLGLASIDLNSQSQVKANIFIGQRLHSESYESGHHAGVQYLIAAPLIGIEINKGELPLSLNWQVDFSIKPTQGYDSIRIGTYGFHETWLENQFQLIYSLKKCGLGLGWYWRKRENEFNHVGPEIYYRKNYGPEALFRLSEKKVSLEFRSKMGLDPFSVIGRSQHSFVLLYNFGNQKNSIKSEKWNFKTSIGSRFFSTKKIERLYGEDIQPIGICPSVGIDALNRKSGISIGVQRDWWIAINGGSFRRDYKGYIVNSFINLGYQRKLANTRSIALKLGWSAIVDYGIIITTSTPNFNKLTTYQVKGIGAALSYELFPKTHLEAKHTFALLGAKPFDITRFSLGLLRSINDN